MKATVKGRYDVDKSVSAATFSLATSGNLLLKASMTDASFVNGPSLNGLALSLQKPGAFIIDYNLPKNDVRFQFMNSAKLLDKTVNLTYVHAQGDSRTALDTSVVFDPANKVNVSYGFGTNSCKVKYVYAHGELRRTVLEPCYDFSNNAWDFAVTRKFEGGDSLRAAYQSSSKHLGLEWNRDSKANGSFKILASFNLAEEQKFPKLIAESTWNYDI